VNDTDCGYICAKCGQDLKPAIDLLGADAWRWHVALHERDEARAEAERLRALCAARPKFDLEHGNPFWKWVEQIDAAGRGGELTWR
jgi:hypothetical protein